MTTRPATACRWRSSWWRGGGATGAGSGRSCTMPPAGGRRRRGRCGCASHGGCRGRSPTMRCWRSWRPASTCGTGSCWSFSPKPGCGSGRRWGCGTATSSRIAASCGSCRARTTPTARGPRRRPWSRSPVSAGLVRLYSAYMFEEYGDCDSDYVVVNLFAEPYGAPLRYQAVHKLACRLRQRSGVDFTLHMLRHTRATSLLRGGVDLEVVARLLGHRSSVTTSQTYAHLETGDLRAELIRSGAWAGGE